MGKENLLKCLHSLGAEEREVELQELQNEYKHNYGVEMNKSVCFSIFYNEVIKICPSYVFAPKNLQITKMLVFNNLPF